MVQLNHLIVTLFDAQMMTHSVTIPDCDGRKCCAFNFVFGLIISLCTVSNATNKHQCSK